MTSDQANAGDGEDKRRSFSDALKQFQPIVPLPGGKLREEPPPPHYEPVDDAALETAPEIIPTAPRIPPRIVAAAPVSTPPPMHIPPNPDAHADRDPPRHDALPPVAPAWDRRRPRRFWGALVVFGVLGATGAAVLWTNHVRRPPPVSPIAAPETPQPGPEAALTPAPPIPEPAASPPRPTLPAPPSLAPTPPPLPTRSAAPVPVAPQATESPATPTPPPALTPPAPTPPAAASVPPQSALIAPPPATPAPATPAPAAQDAAPPLPAEPIGSTTAPAPAASPAEVPAPPGQLARYVAIRYAAGSASAKAEADRLVSKLKPLAMRVLTRTAVSPLAQPTVRYFHTEDTATAQQLASALSGGAAPFHAQGVFNWRAPPPLGAFEVWIPAP